MLILSCSITRTLNLCQKGVPSGELGSWLYCKFRSILWENTSCIQPLYILEWFWTRRKYMGCHKRNRE